MGWGGGSFHGPSLSPLQAIHTSAVSFNHSAQVSTIQHRQVTGRVGTRLGLASCQPSIRPTHSTLVSTNHGQLQPFNPGRGPAGRRTSHQGLDRARRLRHRFSTELQTATKRLNSEDGPVTARRILSSGERGRASGSALSSAMEMRACARWTASERASERSL